MQTISLCVMKQQKNAKVDVRQQLGDDGKCEEASTAQAQAASSKRKYDANN